MFGFTLIGYTIRKKYFRQDKTESEIITLQSECHPNLDIKYSGPHSQYHSDGFKDVFHTFKNIANKYDELTYDEKKNYSFLAIAVEKTAFKPFYESLYDSDKIKTDFKIEDEISSEYKIEFCGFDVLDVESDMGISIIQHCGYEWYKAGKISLNRYQLFGDYENAKDFAESCNKLIHAHSPCAVWAIWRIEEVK